MAENTEKPHLSPVSSHVEHVLEAQGLDGLSLHHHDLDLPDYDDVNHPKVRNNTETASAANIDTDAVPPRTGRWLLD
jgi:hypothetical protein